MNIYFFHLFQYFIRFEICPADLLHPPPYPHLKSLYPFGILFPHCPNLRSVHRDAPYQCFNHSFLDVSIAVVVVSVLPLGRFFGFHVFHSFLFSPFSLIPNTTLLSETHLAYPIVFFPLVFFLSSNPLSPPLAGFHL